MLVQSDPTLLLDDRPIKINEKHLHILTTTILSQYIFYFFRIISCMTKTLNFIRAEAKQY